MKFLLVIFFLTFNNWSEKYNLPFDRVEHAILSKNANMLMKFGYEKLSITWNEEDKVYSNQQAIMFFSDLFKKNNPKQFKFIFKGKENPEGSFGIAQYIGDRQKLRFTFHFKKIDKVNKIFRIIIEEE